MAGIHGNRKASHTYSTYILCPSCGGGSDPNPQNIIPASQSTSPVDSYRPDSISTEEFLVKYHIAALSLVYIIVYALPAHQSLYAQEEILTVENEFSTVFVTTGQKSGRFWFAAGKEQEYARYTYAGARNATTITSNVVFRIEEADGRVYYSCNAPTDLMNGGRRPEAEHGEVPFLPYDSLLHSPNNDSLEIYWTFGAYSVTMRFVAEKPANSYDNGADILLEFEARLRDPKLAGAKLGVFLMLDTDNSSIDSNISDKATLITDRSIYTWAGTGGLLSRDSGTIPDYYLVGLFDIPNNLITPLVPVHRLTGMSLRGAPLTQPNMFGIGGWRTFRSLSWAYPRNLPEEFLGDVAVALRWEDIKEGEVVRTAFGTTSRSGNNLQYCFTEDMFGTFRTNRVIHILDSGMGHVPGQVTVEMWVGNVHDSVDIAPEFEIDTSFVYTPDNGARISLDNASPVAQRLHLKPRQVKKLEWTFSADSIPAIGGAEFRIRYVGDSTGVVTEGFADCTLPLAFDTLIKIDIPIDTTSSDTTSSDTTSSDTTSFVDYQRNDRDGTATSGSGNQHLLSVRPVPLSIANRNRLIVRVQKIGSDAGLSLVNARGETVFTIRLSHNDIIEPQEIPIQLSDRLPAGVYYLRLESDDVVESQKIIITD